MKQIANPSSYYRWNGRDFEALAILKKYSKKLTPLLPDRQTWLQIEATLYRSLPRDLEIPSPLKQGLLLTGASGSGKSLFALRLAETLELPIFSGNGRDFKTSSEWTRFLFEIARHDQGFVWVQNIEEVLKNIGEPQFYGPWDDVLQKTSGLFYCFSSPHPDRLTKTLLVRPSRLDRHYRFQPPTAADSIALFQNLWATAQIPEFLFPEVEKLKILIDGATFENFEEARFLIPRCLAEAESLPRASLLIQYFEERTYLGAKSEVTESYRESIEARLEALDTDTLLQAADLAQIIRKVAESGFRRAMEFSGTPEIKSET